MFPPKLIKKPLVWEVGQKFKVVTNVRQASVTDEIGVVCLELDGQRDEVKAAIAWLEKMASASSRWKSAWWKARAFQQKL